MSRRHGRSERHWWLVSWSNLGSPSQWWWCWLVRQHSWARVEWDFKVLVPVYGQKYRFLLDSRVLKPERFWNRECSRKVYLFFKVSKSTQIGALWILLGKIWLVLFFEWFIKDVFSCFGRKVEWGVITLNGQFTRHSCHNVEPSYRLQYLPSFWSICSLLFRLLIFQGRSY